MFFNAYKLDNFLSRRFIEKACQGKVVNEYPDLDNLLREYKDLLSEYEYAPVFTTHGQTYERTIDFAYGDYYTLHWNVDYAMQVIKQFNLKPLNLSVDALINVVDMDNIDKKYFSKSLRNKEPIILALHPFLKQDKQHIILDGNHRVASRHRNKDKIVTGYILDPEHHYLALQSAIDRLLFLVHQNVVTLVEYITGKADKEELDFYLDNIKKFKEDEEERLKKFFNI